MCTDFGENGVFVIIFRFKSWAFTEKKKEKDNTDMTNYFNDSESFAGQQNSLIDKDLMSVIKQANKKPDQISPIVDILINDKLVVSSNGSKDDGSASSNNLVVEIDDDLSNNNDSDSDSDSDSSDSDTPKKVTTETSLLTTNFIINR